MSSYLDQIVSDVRRRLEERKRRTSLSELRVGSREPRPSFAEAIRAPGLSLIAEIKRASPSKGPLRPSLDVGDLARRYEAAGARAVSVLTEQDHFLGAPQDLERAAGAVDLPVLQKDFVVDDYQVYEAAALGASAVLLIVALLDPRELAARHEAAAEAGLDVLVEVHDEAELEQALALEGAIIGINNRDLRSFEVSLDTTFRLVCRIPPEVTVVSESGVRGREDFERLDAAGIDGVLVGEHIVTREDVEAAIRELLPEESAAGGHDREATCQSPSDQKGAP